MRIPNKYAAPRYHNLYSNLKKHTLSDDKKSEIPTAKYNSCTTNVEETQQMQKSYRFAKYTKTHVRQTAHFISRIDDGQTIN